MNKLRGIILLIAASVFFGIMPIWVKLAYATGLTAFDVTFLRSGLAAAMLGLYICLRHGSLRVERQQLGPLLLSGGPGYTGTILTLYLSYNYVSSGVATSLHYLYPVLVMLAAFFLYREKLPYLKWMALLASLAGIFMIANVGGARFSFTGVALAAASAFFFAFYVLSINHPQLKKMNSLVLAFYVCLIAAGASLVLVLVQGKPFPLTLKGLYYTILVSFFCTVLALIFFIKGVQITGPANASILSTLEPVVSLIAGIILLHEPLTLYTSAGCSLIIAAVIMIGWSDLRDGPQV